MEGRRRRGGGGGSERKKESEGTKDGKGKWQVRSIKRGEANEGRNEVERKVGEKRLARRSGPGTMATSSNLPSSSVASGNWSPLPSFSLPRNWSRHFGWAFGRS
jgi:hypothetical protein